MDFLAPANAPPLRRNGLRARAALLVGALALFLAAPGPAARAEEDLNERSLPLRTALHHDPALDAPFERLCALYAGAGRSAELAAMYRAHVLRYPQDEAAAVVWVRLLVAANDPDARGATQTALEIHPGNAYLHRLLATLLRAAHDAGALAELERAIELEAEPERRARWVDELVGEALAMGRRDLAERRLREAAAAPGAGPEAKLAVARRMLEAGMAAAALAVLEAATGATAGTAAPGPELGVELELAAAAAESALEQRDAAAARLERLLGRLAADHWKRPEVARRRAALARTEAERERLLADARARVAARATDEAAALDLAAYLAGFERRREALDLLLDAGRRLPDSLRLERATLDLLTRLQDDRMLAAWLDGRIRAFPERRDLARLRARTLCLLGQGGEADRVAETAARGLAAPERAAFFVELGRDLRRATAPADAARAFEQALAAAPERLDFRREAAEILLALGERTRARRLFAAGIPAGAAPEAALDAAGFLIRHGMYPEARAVLAPLLAGAAPALEALLALADLEGRSGAASAGAAALAAARALADTGPRYARWLEAAVGFAERFQCIPETLAEEEKALRAAGGAPEGARGERVLAFADACARNGRQAAALGFLRDQLDAARARPVAEQVPLRRAIVDLLERDAAEAKGEAMLDQLQSLATADPERAERYRARLALAHARRQRLDLAQPLIQALSVPALDDAALLGEVERLCETLRLPEKRGRVLERITDLDPGRRDAWERRFSLLASAGDEPGLRAALRGFLRPQAGAKRDEEIDAVLRDYLTDSCWRSITRLLAPAAAMAPGAPTAPDVPAASPAPSAGLKALALLDEAERTPCSREAAIWVAWTRAFLLHRLGRTPERDEAIRELERLAGEAAPAEAEGAGVEAAPRIAFPDGRSISPAWARELLRAPARHATATGPGGAVGERAGPLPPFRFSWAFDTGGAQLSGLYPVDAGCVLATDRNGTLSCLDAATGKLRWDAPAVLDAEPAPPAGLTTGDGRVFTPRRDRVECRSLENGRLLWRADLGLGPRPARLRLFLHAGKLLACAPADGRVAVFHPATGKLLHEADLPEDSRAAQAAVARSRAGEVPPSSGAVCSGDLLLLYGFRTAILDARSLAPIWWLEPERMRGFPPRIAGPAGGGAAGPAHGGRTAEQSFARWGYPFGQRLADLRDGRLLLATDSQVACLPLALPFGTTVADAGGAWVGVCGRFLCLLKARNLRCVNLEDGAGREIDLAELGDPPYDAIVDGPLVYVAGSRAIAAFAPASGERLFLADRPLEARPDYGAKVWSTALPGWTSTGGAGLYLPLLARAASGRLLLQVSPTRFAVLTGGAADGR